MWWRTQWRACCTRGRSGGSVAVAPAPNACLERASLDQSIWIRTTSAQWFACYFFITSPPPFSAAIGVGQGLLPSLTHMAIPRSFQLTLATNKGVMAFPGGTAWRAPTHNPNCDRNIESSIVVYLRYWDLWIWYFWELAFRKNSCFTWVSNFCLWKVSLVGDF